MIKTVDLVKGVLTCEPLTRNSDHLLYYYVCWSIFFFEGINLEILDFATLFAAPNEYGLPQFETVSRARRKLQHDFPELVGNEKVSIYRAMNQDAFQEFAKEGM